MSATRSIYTIERSDYTLAEAIDLVMQLFHLLCAGTDRLFHYHFELTDIHQLDEYCSRFQIINSNLTISFETENAAAINDLLSVTHLYKETLLYNYKSGQEKTWSSFWLQFDSIKKKIIFRLGLPYAAGIQRSKEELSLLLKFLTAKGIIWMVEEEVDEIAGLIIDLNTRGFRGNWVYRDYIELSVPANFTPLNSSQVRPAEVYIHFNENDYLRMGSYENLGIACNNALSEYFIHSGYRVKGTVFSEMNGGIIEKIKGKEWSELRIPLTADLSRFNDFSINDLLFSGAGREEIRISHFTWKDSESAKSTNEIVLSITDPEIFQLEIIINNEVPETYLGKIEELIWEKLVLKGRE